MIEAVRLLDLGVRFMIDGKRTGGAFSLVEHPLPPRALGSPLHTHHNEDEYSYVLEGRFGVQPARLLELISPAGFEHYFRDLAPLLAAPERDQDAIGEVVTRHQLDIDFASVPVLGERHHLRLG